MVGFVPFIWIFSEPCINYAVLPDFFKSRWQIMSWMLSMSIIVNHYDKQISPDNDEGYGQFFLMI